MNLAFVSNEYFRTETSKWLFLADVLVPYLRMCGYESVKKVHALLGIEVNNINAVFAKPFDTSLKCSRFTDDHGANTELPNKAAAVPARSERRRHDHIAIRTLATGLAKRIGLAVDRRIVLLHAPIMAAAKNVAIGVEQSGTDRNAALGEA